MPLNLLPTQSILDSNTPMRNEIIALGMYAISPKLEEAWKTLFLLVAERNPTLSLPSNIVNSTDSEVVLANRTRLSHICGFPLVEKYATQLMPLCAPNFDIEGLSGPEYFSYFMVNNNSHVKSVEESDGLVAAVNGVCSHSGMNVLRHEIEKVHNKGHLENFFSHMIYSGTHANSIQNLLDGMADIAAIDAATYCYLQRINPELDQLLRIVGKSVKMTSPPLVTHINNPLCDPASFTKILNSALAMLNVKQRELLNIKAFSEVSEQDYMPMLAL